MLPYTGIGKTEDLMDAMPGGWEAWSLRRKWARKFRKLGSAGILKRLSPTQISKILSTMPGVEEEFPECLDPAEETLRQRLGCVLYSELLLSRASGRPWIDPLDTPVWARKYGSCIML